MHRLALLLVLSSAAALLGCTGGDDQGASSSPGSEAGWMITDLGTLGGIASRPAAINERGQVVGSSSAATPDGLRIHAFLWEDGEMRDLGTLPGYRWSKATDINERGQIIGVAGKTLDMSDPQGFLWEDGDIRDLGLVGAPIPIRGDEVKRVVAINDRGQIIGTKCEPSSEAPYVEECHAFVWERGEARRLGGTSSWATGLNERGQVIGKTADSRGDHGKPIWRAFLWEDGAMRKLASPAAEMSAAVGINKVGQVVGCSAPVRSVEQDPCYPEGARGSMLVWRSGSVRLDAPRRWIVPVDINDSGEVTGVIDDFRAFVWQRGVLRDLGTLAGARTEAVAINNRGQVVGSSWIPAQGVAHAFLWEDGRMRDLGTLGGAASDVVAVNNHGQIVGWSDTNQEDERGKPLQHAVLWTLKH